MSSNEQKAEQRPFSNWMGTGLGAICLKAVFGAFDPTWAAKSVAPVFLFTAASTQSFTLIARVLSFAACATGVILWSL
ncbi:hypothetical protein [Loktanella sp. Alg231-35]|uniref:hypothetical protein n=1 Tax=Loktanella sp. Alg231-35 TaxID=1922220 RepID=UPI00131F31B7|nr:hypothetical protein [Loktanella sp. Alg231-35]